ncbi:MULTISPECIES: Hpt domain-containing protein [unclassified Sulfitobacter]|jgi:HPt (histidine-containing phosphotransfer) domain-containing protein|uniref:Hpt domain-containing protein n=1 Tax=unclassified Sulfitobacter TaxID=196795 RepID=UPI001593A82E|nr:Hpt domain-containing protein [Sulfitobacter sp. HGT1]
MIDWAQINTLRDDVGKEEFAEIIDIFIEEVESVFERLRTTPDLKNLGDDLHFLKGSALNLGFSTFSEQCQQGEANSAAGRADQVDIPTILSAYYESKAEFLSALPMALTR